MEFTDAEDSKWFNVDYFPTGDWCDVDDDDCREKEEKVENEKDDEYVVYENKKDKSYLGISMLFTKNEEKADSKFPGKTFFWKMELKKLLEDKKKEITYYTDFLLNELNHKDFWFYEGTDTRDPCSKMYWIVFKYP